MTIDFVATSRFSAAPEAGVVAGEVDGLRRSDWLRAQVDRGHARELSREAGEAKPIARQLRQRSIQRLTRPAHVLRMEYRDS